MAKLVNKFSIEVAASPKEAYAYISDLTRHTEWSAAPLALKPVKEGATAVGSQFKSVGTMMGKQFKNDVIITELKPSSKFSFEATDGKVTALHEFSITPQGDGSVIERKETLELSAMMKPIFQLIAGPFIAKPAHRKAMAKLKANLARKASIASEG
ncbi:MAG: SRPBCC family protein [Chloroflexi bacterium]|nr:SRPBCC family protein [Chloroflexota bacterium]